MVLKNFFDILSFMIRQIFTRVKKAFIVFFILFSFSTIPSISWALPDCIGARSISWQNCFGTYTFPGGDKYVGEFGDDEFHGQGTFIWKDGFYYEGEFRDGTPNGQGTETLPNGHLVGEYKDGKPWNAKGYDKESKIIAKWVNGVKQK